KTGASRRGNTGSPSGFGSDPAVTPETDFDGDGIPDAIDVCPQVFDPCQQDADMDGVGDACDTCQFRPNGALQMDSDGDGIGDVCDNCPFVANPDQEDIENPDDDLAPNDGVGNACDNCPEHLNPLQTNCNEDAERALG
ncbi:MAG: hypothetical protein HF967_02465, partial [Methanosarcinales archaeon]|nr:hypothetical protein [Methanosarcinales archaeon]